VIELRGEDAAYVRDTLATAWESGRCGYDAWACYKAACALSVLATMLMLRDGPHMT
jgi:hypothetical protein